jgi:flagellar hook-associated protein 3 FlgL
MGGTLGSVYNNVSFALHLQTEAMARLQEQTSTGSRINRASDDPSAAFKILGLNSHGRSLGNYMDNLSEVISTFELCSQIIEGDGGIIPVLVEAKTALTQIASGVYSEEGRKRIAEEIDNILEQIVLLANTKHTGQYIFGGGDTASAPYVVERTNGKITSVTYQGSSEGRNVEVAPQVETSCSYVGDDIFRSNNRSIPVFVGDTGAKAGTGTSNICGDTWLTVIHDGSNYKLSIDDGASYVTVPAGGDLNQAVTDSRTGQVLYVDSTGINSTGVEMVSIPGTYDIFNTLITVRDILNNERGFSPAQLEELLGNSLNSVDEVRNLLVQKAVSIGSKTGFLENLKNSLQKLKYDAEDETTYLEEADIAQIAVDLSRQEVLYQMSLSIAGKLMSMSLLDFIE